MKSETASPAAAIEAVARSVTGNTAPNLPESVNETSDSASGSPRNSRQTSDKNGRAKVMAPDGRAPQNLER
jgi:hypothetical protein